MDKAGKAGASLPAEIPGNFFRSLADQLNEQLGNRRKWNTGQGDQAKAQWPYDVLYG